MSSSRVMASPSSAASDITRQSSINSLKSLGSMNIDELFRNIESDGGGGDMSPATISRQGSVGNVKVDEAWREIDGGEMTLEDFLARAGAVREEDVRVPSGVFGSGGVGVVDPIRGGGRGRKRDTTMDPAERAALQRQKRMIKNRESAARSRERKQAYTAELESLVTQLEEENAQLLRLQFLCSWTQFDGLRRESSLLTSVWTSIFYRAGGEKQKEAEAACRESDSNHGAEEGAEETTP